MADKLVEKEAAYGQKMIEIKLRFWTNDIAEGENKVLPKHAWDKGVVKIAANKSHGIPAGEPIPFNSMLEVGRAVERCLIENGIKLHAGQRSRRYLSSD